MGKITREELNDKLVEDIVFQDELGNYVTKEELGNVDMSDYVNNEHYDSEVGEIENLHTAEKTLVGAINEVYEVAYNIKQRIVDMLAENEIEASTSEDLDSLMSKLEIFINEGGGGGDVNLEGGSTTLPNIVVENQLYVSTDVTINGMIMSNNQPEIGTEIQEGGVWVYHGLECNGEAYEYMLAEDPKVTIFIYDCFQVIDGVFVKKDLYCGANGEWVLVNGAKIFIDAPSYFDEEFINSLSITSGVGLGFTIIKHNDIDGSLQLSTANKNLVNAIMSPNNKIDLTKYNKIKVQYDLSKIKSSGCNGSIALCKYDSVSVSTSSQAMSFVGKISDEKTFSMSDGILNDIELEIDISSFSGYGYIGIQLYINKDMSSDECNININKWWME